MTAGLKQDYPSFSKKKYDKPQTTDDDYGDDDLSWLDED